MAWNRIEDAAPPVERPVYVRPADGDAVVAFLGRDTVWYAGGALVQNATTILGFAPVAWCEPQGDDRL